MRWTITITNTGAASATLGTVTDAISASTDVRREPGHRCTRCGSVARAVRARRKTRQDVDSSWTSPVTHGRERIRNSLPLRMTPTASNLNGANVTVNFATVMPVEGVTYAAGELKPGESVIVYFNVTVELTVR